MDFPARPPQRQQSLGGSSQREQGRARYQRHRFGQSEPTEQRPRLPRDRPAMAFREPRQERMYDLAHRFWNAAPQHFAGLPHGESAHRFATHAKVASDKRLDRGSARMASGTYNPKRTTPKLIEW